GRRQSRRDTRRATDERPPQEAVATQFTSSPKTTPASSHRHSPVFHNSYPVCTCYFQLWFRIMPCNSDGYRVFQGNQWNDSIERTSCGFFASLRGSLQVGNEPACSR